jgi:hypothetical protein
MACKQLNIDEYQELMDRRPNAKSYNSSAECDCCAEGCCAYAEIIGVWAEAVTEGWSVRYSQPPGEENPASSFFAKLAPCDGPPTETFTWRQVDDPSNEQTGTAYMSTSLASCCEGECALKCCTGCGEGRGINNPEWHPDGNGGCILMGCETDCANLWDCGCLGGPEIVDYRPEGPCPPE